MAKKGKSTEPDRFVPLSRRVDPAKVEEYLAPLPGIPSHLVDSLESWLYSAAAAYKERTSENAFAALERITHVDLKTAGDFFGPKLNPASVFRRQPDGGLDVIDAMLGLLGRLAFGGTTLADRLNTYLEEGGSEWRVVERGDDGWVLERRVDEAVAENARLAMERGRPGAHLREAWGAIYGRRPNPSHAYREAVRAVEAAGKPVISPENERATLGTMIRDLEQKPEKWDLRLDPEGQVGPVDVLVANMKLLWKSQLDRHGTDDESADLHVSQGQAEDAVHLALMLVHWFESGAVHVRTGKEE